VKVVPLAVHSPRAVEDALRSRGWDPGRAADAAGGIHPAAFLLTGLESAALEALVRYGGQLGLGIITGDDWAVLAGSASRLSALARPWVVPAPLADLAVALGLAMPAVPARVWETARGSVALDHAVIVGILNVTPDSFSDGGRHSSVGGAVEHAARLHAAGAAIIDVGGESTRPGRNEAVSLEEELRRTIPVVTALVREHPDLLVSIDTVKAPVARAALDAGAAIVNDVSALRLDPAMASVVAAGGAGVVLMHSRGGILELASYRHAQYPGGVTAAVLGELRDAVLLAGDAGVPDARIVIDPGLGFSKTVSQNLTLLDQLAVLLTLGRPIMVGPSRKRFLAPTDPPPAPADTTTRDTATAAACVVSWERGARLFRVHDAAATRDALALAQSLEPSTDPA
jgi:dihydropteroate synthase